MCSNDTFQATQINPALTPNHCKLIRIRHSLWPVNNPWLQTIYSTHTRIHSVCELCWGKTSRVSVLRENNSSNTAVSHILPAVRPQRPAAGDSGSCAVQQSHICFGRQPVTLQLTRHCGNLPKNNSKQPSALTEAVNVLITGLFLVCFHFVHSHACEALIIWKICSSLRVLLSLSLRESEWQSLRGSL